jgi:hypothetical protein
LIELQSTRPCHVLHCVAQPDDAQAVLLERLGVVLPKRMRMRDVDLPGVALNA